MKKFGKRHDAYVKTINRLESEYGLMWEEHQKIFDRILFDAGWRAAKRDNRLLDQRRGRKEK